jgi:hypothetical protein
MFPLAALQASIAASLTAYAAAYQAADAFYAAAVTVAAQLGAASLASLCLALMQRSPPE